MGGGDPHARNPLSRDRGAEGCPWGRSASRVLGVRPAFSLGCDCSPSLSAQGADGIRGLKGTKGEKVSVPAPPLGPGREPGKATGV